MAFNPIDNPQDYDYVVIAGVKSPGIVRVQGFSRGNSWDEKKGKGTVGATLTYVAKPPAKGTLTFYLWLAEHWEQWDTFRPLLKYDPTKKSTTAVDVFYPTLDNIDVHSLVIEDLGGEEPVGEPKDGFWQIAVKAIEYFPPPKKSAVSTPGGSTNKDPAHLPGTPPDPVTDALQKQLADLSKEASTP